MTRKLILALVAAVVLASSVASAQTSANMLPTGTARPTSRGASLTDGTCSDSVFTTQSGCIVVPIGGNSATTVQTTGTWTGTNNVEITNYVTGFGTPTWRPLNVTPTNGSTTVTTHTANGAWFGTAIGTYIRVRRSTPTSGTPIVSITLTQGGGAGGSGGGGGGGGGAVTAGDGDLVAIGATTDTAIADSDGTLIAHTRSIAGQLATVIAGTSTAKVAFASTPTVNLGTAAVTNAGTFAVQLTGSTNNINNIGGTVSLPTGAATAANQATEITSLQLIDDPVTTLGTNTYTEGTTKAFVIAGVRRDADTTMVDTTNELAPLSIDASGNLKIKCVSGCGGSGGTAMTDNAAFTVGTTSITPTGGTYKSARSALTDNAAGTFALTAKRGLYISPETPNGDSMANETADSMRTTLYDATGTALSFSTDATTNTTAQTSGPQIFLVGSAATPSAVGADGRSVGMWSDLVGRVHITGDSSMGKLLVTPDANSAINLAQINGNTPSTGNGATSSTGSFRVTIASDSTGVLAPIPTALSGNGLSTCYITSAATTNSTNCKSSAGNLYAIHLTNTTSTNYFLRLYNASSAPTCSSNTGFVETVPALGAAANGGVNGRAFAMPQAFSTGIGFCLTGGGADNDNTSAATGVYATLEYRH